jgi:chromosome segregation ATPase
MATKVSRELKEINEVVANLDKSITSLTAKNRDLDKSLKLDPTNTVLLTNNTKNLQEAIDAATDKVKALKNAQVQMKAAIDSGKGSSDEYNKLKLAAAKAEAQLKSLNAEIIKTSKANLTGVAQQLQPVARAAQAALAGIVALGVGFAKTGDEIQKASEKYRIRPKNFSAVIIFLTGQPAMAKPIPGPLKL